MLEPCEGKLSRTVLRGEGDSNIADLLDRPSDLVQRTGRTVRQGNENDVVYLYRYVTKGTFDSYLWQIQEQKLQYISQVMTGKSISRSCSDLDETVLSAAEVKAIATNNPLLSEKMNIDNEVVRLQLVKSNWADERVNLQQKIQDYYPTRIVNLEKNIEISKAEMTTLDAFPIQKDEKGKDSFLIQLDGIRYDNRTEAFEKLVSLIKPERLSKDTTTVIGEYSGLTLSARKVTGLFEAEIYINNRPAINFSDSTGTGNLTRLQNKVNDFPKDLKQKEAELKDSRKQLEMAKQEINKPFEHEEKLSNLLNRQSEINRQIEFGVSDEEVVSDEPSLLMEELFLDNLNHRKVLSILKRRSKLMEVLRQLEQKEQLGKK